MLSVRQVKLVMKKEIRGHEAVRYAEEQGILFDIDEDYMLAAEGELLGRAATKGDLHNLFMQRLGRRYDPTDVFPGEENFNLLVERYGDQWVCVPLRGNHPEQEEEAALGLFRNLLSAEEPVCEGDILDLATDYGLQLVDTGFPPWATTNLLYHAALRLVAGGWLGAVMDKNPPPEAEGRSYGNRRFFVPPDAEVSLSGVLCDRCQDEMQYSSPGLHRECAARLRTALGKVGRSALRKGSL